MPIQSAKELIVYQRAYQLSMLIFECSKRFPAEERFALTSQIRRSSRSVCLNLREAWAKRRYPASFIAKLTDCGVVDQCGLAYRPRVQPTGARYAHITGPWYLLYEPF